MLVVEVLPLAGTLIFLTQQPGVPQGMKNDDLFAGRGNKYVWWYLWAKVYFVKASLMSCEV
jgi:hypothetical protein